jgi:hypothetical protein
MPTIRVLIADELSRRAVEILSAHTDVSVEVRTGLKGIELKDGLPVVRQYSSATGGREGQRPRGTRFGRDVDRPTRSAGRARRPGGWMLHERDSAAQTIGDDRDCYADSSYR